MEQYREKLKLTQRIVTVAAVILFAFAIVAIIAQAGVLNITPETGDSHWQSRWRGFVCGASCGLGILMLAWRIRISKALHSEKELKKLFVEVHDERMNQIYTSARATAMQIFLIVGLVAAVVSGYFNMTVSITILVCVFVHSILGGALKIYYSKKF